MDENTTFTILFLVFMALIFIAQPNNEYESRGPDYFYHTEQEWNEMIEEQEAREEDRDYWEY